MNCQEFWKSDNPDQSDHLNKCPACAAAWSRQQMVAAGLHVLAAEWRSVEAPARVESRVVSAFQTHTALNAQPSWPRWAPIVAGLSAATGLLLVAFLAVRGPEQAKPVHRVSPAAVQLATTGSSLDFDESAGEFIPVPNTTQIESDEEMNLVRVEVPRSAMIALGYEVSADRAWEPISADVMLGADGLVRAVRFLDD